MTYYIIMHKILYAAPIFMFLGITVCFYTSKTNCSSKSTLCTMHDAKNSQSSGKWSIQ